MPPSNGTTGNGNGSKWGWLVKLLAGAFIMAILAWFQWSTAQHYSAASEIATIKEREQNHYAELKDKLGSIDKKMDILIAREK